MTPMTLDEARAALVAFRAKREAYPRDCEHGRFAPKCDACDAHETWLELDVCRAQLTAAEAAIYAVPMPVGVSDALAVAKAMRDACAAAVRAAGGGSDAVADLARRAEAAESRAEMNHAQATRFAAEAHALEKQVAHLTARLTTARVDALEEAAKVADDIGQSWGAERNYRAFGAAERIRDAIRALAAPPVAPETLANERPPSDPPRHYADAAFDGAPHFDPEALAAPPGEKPAIVRYDTAGNVWLDLGDAPSAPPPGSIPTRESNGSTTWRRPDAPVENPGPVEPPPFDACKFAEALVEGLTDDRTTAALNDIVREAVRRAIREGGAK